MDRMFTDLKGKAIAVMGGTSGIGLAVVEALIQAGTTVVTMGRDDEYMPHAMTVGARGVLTGDACNPADADRLISETMQSCGQLHGLIHVAGGSGRSFGDGRVHELTDDGLRQTMELNFHSAVWSNRAAIRIWNDQNVGGSIVNVGSVLARHPAPEFFSTHAYAAAKAALEGFSRAAAAYYASKNIRINVVASGLVTTPMSRRASGNAAIQEFIIRKQPLDGGRIGRPDDLAAAILYFMSDVSHFCTGQVLNVDGGWGLT